MFELYRSFCLAPALVAAGCVGVPPSHEGPVSNTTTAADSVWEGASLAPDVTPPARAAAPSEGRASDLSASALELASVGPELDRWLSGDLGQEAAPAAPAHSEQDADALAKKTQNPVADLISVPFQNNFGFDYGDDDDVQWVLNIQPVVPVHLSTEWNLINRVITPVIYQPGVAPGQGDIGGLGDIQYQGYFSPAGSTSFIWGAGPVIQFPSATDKRLGARRWAIGPAVVALVMEGPWVGGALASNIWSLGESSSRPDVNQLLIQPFLNYNFGEGWYVTSAPIITANWEAAGSDTWLVPVGGGLGKLFRIEKLPINTQVQAFYNVAHPDVGPDWELRFQLQLLF